jgi:hypothetical protein
MTQKNSNGYTASGGAKPKIAIGFFGITRSLKWTLSSIQNQIFIPARKIGEVRVFAHLFHQDRIVNPRTGENNIVDPNEYKLLNCDEIILEKAGDCLSQRNYNLILSHGDAFQDNGKSLANLIHQLHSLEKVGSLISSWMPDVVILVRPDLIYHDSFFDLIKQHLSLSDHHISIPGWQLSGGMNDRFAVCGPKSAEAYSKRINLMHAYMNDSNKPLHSERLLRYALNKYPAIPIMTKIRASRIRSSGEVFSEDFGSISISKKIRWTFDYIKAKFQTDLMRLIARFYS